MTEDREIICVFHALSRYQALLGAAHLPAMLPVGMMEELRSIWLGTSQWSDQV